MGIESRLRRVPFPALRDVVVKRPSTGPNLDVLDGVRGLAVGIVVASHTGGLALEGHGNVGVWLFFALSAFLLTRPFATRPERATDPGHLRHYTARRLRRILPAYYFVLALNFGLARRDLDALWRHLAFVRADGIYWTIPQEMLFYAVLPVVAILHPVMFRCRTAATLAALAGLTALADLTLDADVLALNGNGKQLPFYLGLFLPGVAFAYAHASPRLTALAARPLANRALAALGWVVLAGLFFTAEDWWRHLAPAAVREALGPRPSLAYRGATGVACAALVYAAVACPGRLLHRLLASLPLRALGVVSFSLYLFHVPVRGSLLNLGVPAGNALFALTLLGSYAVAAGVYTFVERPFLGVHTTGGRP